MTAPDIRAAVEELAEHADKIDRFGFVHSLRRHARNLRILLTDRERLERELAEARRLAVALGFAGDFGGDPIVEAQRAEQTMQVAKDHWQARAFAVEARNKVLEEALRPFADCVELIGTDEPDDEWAKFRLLISDYRRARSALAGSTGSAG